MNTAEMQAMARRLVAEALRDGQDGRLDAVTHLALLIGLRRRMNTKRSTSAPAVQKKDTEDGNR